MTAVAEPSAFPAEVTSQLGSILNVTCPISGDLVGQVSITAPDDVVQAVDKARAAQTAWAAKPLRERARVFKRFHDLLLDRREEVLDIVTSETGKTKRDAFVEVFGAAVDARWSAYHGPRDLRSRRVNAAIPFRDTTRINYHPVGVVGVITPWNFPLAILASDVFPALMAGNGVVLKPSEHAPLTADWLREGLIDAGLPEDLFQVIHGDGAELGGPLIDNVDFIQFTGSTRVGFIIAERSAQRLIPYSLELGGKNAIIILPDANIRQAATVTLDGAFTNSGQLCLHFERVFVDASIYEAFTTEITKQIREIRLGRTDDYTTDMGSLVNGEQFARVQSHVTDAIQQGASILYGGNPRPDLGPCFFEPTILTNVPPSARVFREETFGPVLSIHQVASVDEAVRLTNDSSYGLHAAVIGGNRRHAESIARQLEVGTVSVNEAYMPWAATSAPLGGRKHSGLGRRHGPEGFRKYTEPQTIVNNRLPWQISSQETALSFSDGLADVLVVLLRLWRRIPFIR